ncbi:MAG: hypothetical protein ETSY2_22285 [Candidatus Entotheonella gemina]|uniref:Uncharacterized protein n=2 Tax=Candidatus Entotheonella TaxID=93171 RepID=W4M5R5_9BACT|nr:MAG: hypothetical protein ETSY2_22285 [Candidatus Entotheonella gemina]
MASDVPPAGRKALVAKIPRFVSQIAFDDVDRLFLADGLDFDLQARGEPVGIVGRLEVHEQG